MIFLWRVVVKTDRSLQVKYLRSGGIPEARLGIDDVLEIALFKDESQRVSVSFFWADFSLPAVQ